MNKHPTALERAFELARTGDYARVSEIADQLNKEGLSGAQVTGPSLTSQLRAIINQTRPVDA